MSESIEEAWERLAHWPGGLNSEQRRVMQAVARALALAVLEEAIPSRFHTKVERVGVDALRYEDFRARIEALGEAAT